MFRVSHSWLNLKRHNIKKWFYLNLLSQDLIALEGHCHKSCYREYEQKVEKLSTSSNESKSSSGTNLYKDVKLEKLFQRTGER